MNNTGPEFTDGNNWFTVLGVYFPTVTGVMAGINMSGDLKNPTRDMPNGTLAAISLRFVHFIYVPILSPVSNYWFGIWNLVASFTFVSFWFSAQPVYARCCTRTT